ncbi:hypothetical protein [Mucilaginibacter sp. UYCu711]
MDITDNCIFAGFALFIIVLLYIIIKMIWNRIQGHDELDGFFLKYSLFF